VELTMTDLPGELVRGLVEWLSIPSVSTDGGNRPALRRAADWACERIVAAGGHAECREDYGNPMVVGELRSRHPDAPTVLIYGHADVQGVGDPEAWLTDPFVPEIRDGRIYARGASDDKGNFLPLLHAACSMARAGEQAVHVRILIDGEEEIAGQGCGAWLRDDERGADCAIVFDSWMVDERTPAITIGLRGLVQIHLMVRTGVHDLHSGAYGGSVLNAAHVLHEMLTAVQPGPDGRLRPELRVGISEPGDDERAEWARLPSGDAVLAEAGGRLLHPSAGSEYYMRTWSDASLDVNGIRLGAERTIVPAVAHAALSQRLVPDQRAHEIAAVLERLLCHAAPDGADVEMRLGVSEPVLFEPTLAPLRVGVEALQRATGMRPAIVRWGGAIPVVSALAAVGIPTIVSGFALPDDLPHAANESFRLESIRLGLASGHALLTALAGLVPGRVVPTAGGGR
jgi:acetylornithine deacetylase/succinyl-diaminopimelate desuccinylase-like protein